MSLPSSNPDVEIDETVFDRLLRKSKKEPLVPLGMAMTCGALYFAAKAVKAGDSRLANRMFFWRVGLQGFTVAALVGGGLFMTSREAPNREEMMRQRAKEREALWIEELERIDSESKERQKRAQSIQEAFLRRREEAKREEEEKRGN
ncbi:respiratory supercomplex factor 1, mitochondrial [Trichomonascus vanleenenianus]|uniref:HIG1 domain-containing protein n=1 Tax=Trichomonascus vanleenenianus TaxID=2268995 RepID=UPI003ECA1EEB